MSSPFRRPSPEELLRRVQAEEEYERRGRLKIFLGYASGVGKSFRMLDEGRRRKERGQDIVVGAIQPKSTPELDEVLRKLEVIPLKTSDGIACMDVDLILKRRPAVCLVDGLAYDNPPGSARAHRWQDVEQLLEAGIGVITSINLQYVEERRDEVARIQGKRAIAWNRPPRGPRRFRWRNWNSGSRSCVKSHCCWRRMWSTTSWKVTSIATAWVPGSAHRSGFWCA
jgi:two-component system sensor histidine kinase KdpD